MTDPRASALRSRASLSLEAWTALHVAAVWLACVFAFALRFHEPEGPGFVPAAVHSLAVGAALLLGRVLRVAVLDFLAQLQYREKFLLFLVHLGIMVVPWFLGFRGWGHALGALAALLCFQSAARVAYGRIYAVTVLLAIPGVLYPPLPPFGFVAAWILALLLAFRAEHVRWRLESFGHGEGTDLRDALQGTLAGAIVPWLAGCATWLAARAAFGNGIRIPQFEPGPVNAARSENIGPVAPTDLIWDAVMVVAVIVALLLAIYWLEKYLRTNRKGATAAAEAPGAGRESRIASAAAEEPPGEEPFADDARGRVLARFRSFDKALARVGLQRRDQETAAEFVARLARSLAGAPESMAPVFDRACYARGPLTDEEAIAFLRAADEVEPRAIDLAEKARFIDAGKPPAPGSEA